MKRTLLLLAVSALFFTSCKKCVECTDCAEGVTLDQTEYCQDDFDSKDEYNSAVALIEAFGCDCK
jgi:hypothetical protein